MTDYDSFYFSPIPPLVLVIVLVIVVLVAVLVISFLCSFRPLGGVHMFYLHVSILSIQSGGNSGMGNSICHTAQGVQACHSVASRLHFPAVDD